MRWFRRSKGQVIAFSGALTPIVSSSAWRAARPEFGNDTLLVEPIWESAFHHSPDIVAYGLDGVERARFALGAERATFESGEGIFSKFRSAPGRAIVWTRARRMCRPTGWTHLTSASSRRVQTVQCSSTPHIRNQKFRTIPISPIRNYARLPSSLVKPEMSFRWIPFSPIRCYSGHCSISSQAHPQHSTSSPATGCSQRSNSRHGHCSCLAPSQEVRR
jgi:hypothetical protein